MRLKAEVLRQVPYFGEPEAGAHRDFAGLVRDRKCRPGEVILLEGKRCEGQYVVLSGASPRARPTANERASG